MSSVRLCGGGGGDGHVERLDNRHKSMKNEGKDMETLFRRWSCHWQVGLRKRHQRNTHKPIEVYMLQMVADICFN